MNRKKSIKVRTTMDDYSKIKPIASKAGTSYYLKPCADNGKSSLYNPDYEYGDKVNYKNLAYIADFKVNIPYSFYIRFKDSINCVLHQLPPYLLAEAVAFELIYMTCVGINDLFKVEHDNGFNVAIVRLYKKNANMSQAESIKYCEYYPYENAPIPINMKPDDLKKCTVRYR